MTFPRVIAVCGNPTAGKTEAQEILERDFGVDIIDSGMVLREFAVQHLGLSWDDVVSQAGKLRKTTILDREWENREILGELGKKLEELFGENILMWIALKKLKPGRSYSICVRRNQGLYLKSQGALVIGLNNPLAPVSRHDFDAFNTDAVDFWIDNDGLAKGMSKSAARRDLSTKLASVLWQKDAA